MIELGGEFILGRIVLVDLPGARFRIIDVLLGLAVLVGAVPLAAQNGRKILYRLPFDRGLGSGVVGVILAEAGNGQILRETLVAEMLGRQADGQGLADGDVHLAPLAEQIIGAGAEVGLAAKLAEFRLVGDDVDRAADRALAVKGALWPAHYLDMVDVEQALFEGDGVDDVDAVLEQPDARHRGEIVLGRFRADAADGDNVLETGSLGGFEAWHDRVEAGDVGNERLLNRRWPNGGDGDRRLLNVGRPAFGGDDHFPHRRGAGGRGVGRVRLPVPNHQAAERGGCQENETSLRHDTPSDAAASVR